MFTMPEWLKPGDHTSRPAATAVAVGALYSCSDHGLIYQSDGATWSTWATLGITTVAGGDHGTLDGLADDDHPQYATNTEFDDHSARHENGGADEISVAGLDAAIPAGGTAGQRLAKIDGTDYSTEWVSPGAATIDLAGDTGTATGIGDISIIGAGGASVAVTDLGGGSAEVEITAGGGGASGYDLDTYSIDGTYGDDFTAAALTGIWTRRNFVSGAETHQQGKSATYMRVATTGRAVGDGYLQTAPAGDWEFAMAMVARWAAAVMPWGIAVVDTNGTGVGTCFYNAPNAFLVGGITTYSSYGGTFQQCPSFPAGAPPANQTKMWQRLRKSGTNYYASYSLDGEIWSPESPAFSSAITVDRVGMLIHPLGSVGTDYVDVDWFNKIA